MYAHTTSAHNRQLAALVRERFVAGMAQGLLGVDKAIEELLSSLLNQVATARENQLRRDMWTAHQKYRHTWVEATAKAWRAGTQSACCDGVTCVCAGWRLRLTRPTKARK